MTGVRRAFGAWGEQTAEAYLRGLGMVVIDRNWRCPQGELDLVALDGDVIVFCEVKTRRSLVFGSGVEAVIGIKARRLRRLAAAWLAQHGTQGREVRFDVIGVHPGQGGAPRIDHVRGAF